jgi:elongation factor G
MEKKTFKEFYRNIGIIAHIDAGKTTTSERILYYTGTISKIGEVHEGETALDFLTEERTRGITIGSAATQCYWDYKDNEYRINLIDTPGHVDFTIEVERSLRVLDGAICVFDGVEGVQTQTIKVWHQAERYSVPRIVFINKLDRIGADFFYSVQTIIDRLNAKPIILQIPVGSENHLSGCIDLLKMKYIKWHGNKGENYEELEIPAAMREKANEYHKKITEQLLDLTDNEDAMHKYLMGEEAFTLQEKEDLIRKLTIEVKIFPVFCGSAYKNIGVQTLLDGVAKFLPSPLDIKHVSGKKIDESNIEIQLVDEAPFVALVFKITKDKFAGKLSFIRIYSGVLNKSTDLYLPRTKKSMKVGRFVKMHANIRTEIFEAHSGDIVALIGDHDFITGETICTKTNQLFLESIEVPEKVISLALLPKTRADRDKLLTAVQDRSKEDPSFGFQSEENSLRISGMGQLHLEIITNAFKSEYKIDFDMGPPEITYKESIVSGTDIHYEYKKQSGGKGHYAVIDLKIEPINHNSKFEFVSKIVGGVIPAGYIPSVQDGIAEACKKGPLTKSEVTGFRATLYDGKTHDVDSSPLAFYYCASAAMREIMTKVNISLLEPVMLIEIQPISESHLGRVQGLISMKRGRIKDTFDIPNSTSKRLLGTIPLAETSTFITDLRLQTQGESSFNMVFHSYEFVPQAIVQQIRKEKGTLA